MAVGWLRLAAAFVKRSFLGKAWLTVATSARRPPSRGDRRERGGEVVIRRPSLTTKRKDQ